MMDDERLVGGREWKEKVCGMENTPENGKESSNSVHANGKNKPCRHCKKYNVCEKLTPSLPPILKLP
jgi:hypothetical protein